jgi:hypothetical protein
MPPAGHRKNPIAPRRSQRLCEAATHSLKSMGSLLEEPLNSSAIVVTETQVVIQGGEAMFLTGLLYFV